MSATSISSPISLKSAHTKGKGRPLVSQATLAFRTQVADGLLALRQRMGWTRTDLVTLVPDVTVSNLQRWEAAVALPKGLAMLRVIRLLGLDMSSIPAGAFHLASLVRAQRSVKPAGRGKKTEAVIDVSALLQAFRAQQGLPNKEFSALVGVPIMTYMHWESGVQPTGAYVQLVADLLKLPVSAIRNI